MNQSEIDKATRRALNIFDEWNATTGLFDIGYGYYSEIVSIIEDAVDCGIQQALKDFRPLHGEEEK